MHTGTQSGLLKYFPTPKFLTMPAVGIEVTPEAVRFIEFLETRKGIAVGRYGSYPVPKEVASAEDFLASEELKKILSDIGALPVEVKTHPSNPAVKFYEKFGFIKGKVIENYENLGQPRLVLKRI